MFVATLKAANIMMLEKMSSSQPQQQHTFQIRFNDLFLYNSFVYRNTYSTGSISVTSMNMGLVGHIQN